MKKRKHTYPLNARRQGLSTLLQSALGGGYFTYLEHLRVLVPSYPFSSPIYECVRASLKETLSLNP